MFRITNQITNLILFGLRNKEDFSIMESESESEIRSQLPPLTVSYGNDDRTETKTETDVVDGTQQIDISKQIKEQKQNQYRAAYDEIERRKEAVIANTGDTKNTTNIPRAAQLKSQSGYQFAVINKANRFMKPTCKRPAFRILGFFRNNEELSSYIEELRDSNQIDENGICKLGDLHKVPVITHYTLLSKSMDRDRDEKYVISKIAEIKQLHLDHQKMAEEEFKQNREEKKAGRIGLSIEKKREKAKEKRKKSSREAAIKSVANSASASTQKTQQLVGRVPRNLEFREQNHAIIIMLEDITKPVLKGHDDPEPIILLLDAFESKEAAQNAFDSLSHYVFCMSMYIVDMYQWLFPEDLDAKQIEEQYRNPEQNLIMKTKKEKDLEVKKYENEVTQSKSNAIENHSESISSSASSSSISADRMFTEANHIIPRRNETEIGPIITGNDPMEVKIIEETITTEELEKLTDNSQLIMGPSVSGTAADSVDAFQERAKKCM